MDFNFIDRNTFSSFFDKKKQFKLLKESMYEVCNAIDHCVEDDTVETETKRKLFIQRSDINIHIKNWTHAIDDLQKALQYSTDSIINYTQIVDNVVFCYINIKFMECIKFFILKIIKLKDVEMHHRTLHLTNIHIMSYDER